ANLGRSGADIRLASFESSNRDCQHGDARLVTGSYKIAQRWCATAVSSFEPDGIRYPARHDPSRLAFAIFTRPRLSFKVSSLGSPTTSSNRALLNQLLTDYKVDLI